ncbi:unnamed protein product, partial [Adineta steineri]
MSSTYTLMNDDEIYIITLHRLFKIKTIHLINDLNKMLDKCIVTRLNDIAIMVNVTMHTNYTETTIHEIIIRLENGEMKELFHTCDVNRLVNDYISSAVTDTTATLICLKPFTQICLICEEQLEIKFNQSIEIYDMNKVTKGGVYISYCIRCHYQYWPNYYEKKASSQKFVTPISIYDQKFIYFGGKKGYSTELLIHFTSLFLRQYSGFENFQHGFNLSIKKYSQLISDKQMVDQISSEINRECFSTVWYIYQLCLFTFFMDNISELEIPMSLDNSSIYQFFDINYDYWYRRFVQHWSSHHLIHPCCEKKNEFNQCMSAFIIDGMQKVARPICKNKNKLIKTDEFPDYLYVGCGNTPQWKTGLCKECEQDKLLRDNETYLITNDDKGIYDDLITG